MPCLYCGKRVPLVRLSDRDFCSDEHRTRYRKLASSVLDRLGGPVEAQAETPSERVSGKTEPPPRKAGPAGPLPAWACFSMRALARPARPARPGLGLPPGPAVSRRPPAAGSNGLGLAGPAEPAPPRALAPSEPELASVPIAPPRKPPRGAGLRPTRPAFVPASPTERTSPEKQARQAGGLLQAGGGVKPQRAPEPGPCVSGLAGPLRPAIAFNGIKPEPCPVPIAPAAGKPALNGEWTPEPLPPPIRGPVAAPPAASAPSPATSVVLRASSVNSPVRSHSNPAAGNRRGLAAGGGMARASGSVVKYAAERPHTGFSSWLASVQPPGQPLPAPGIAVPAPKPLSFSPRLPAAREEQQANPRLRRAQAAKGKPEPPDAGQSLAPEPPPRRRPAPKRSSVKPRSIRGALEAASYVRPGTPAPAEANGAHATVSRFTTTVLRPELGRAVPTRVPGVVGPLPLGPLACAGENARAASGTWPRAISIPPSRLETVEDHRAHDGRTSTLAGVPARPAVAPVPRTADLRPVLGEFPHLPASSGLKPVSDPKLAPAEHEPVHTPSRGIAVPVEALSVDLAGDRVKGRLGPLRSCFGLRLGVPDLPGSSRSRLRKLAVRHVALPSPTPWALDPRLPARQPLPEPHLFALPEPGPQIDYRALLLARFAAIPVPLRIVVVAAPFLLWISFWARQSAPSFTESMGAALRNRAAVEVFEDFRNGTKHWHGASDWTRSAAGTVRTGRFALLDAGGAVGDYDFEFLGQIRTRRMTWVFRAANARNYYAGSLVIRKPGPVPEFALERYAVIDGRRQATGEVPLPRLMHNDSPYRIKVRVRGDGFATFVEGRLVDYWTHDGLKTGSVGFGAAPDEHAYLYWVKLSYQNDWLGRLCARLAPANQGWTK